MFDFLLQDSLFNEDFSTIIGQGVPCIRIYHSCTNPTLSGDYDVSYVGKTQSVTENFTSYNHYIFTDISSHDFMSVLAQLCTSLPVICSGSDMYNQAGLKRPHLIQTGNVRVMYVTDNVVDINSRLIKWLSIDTINSDNLFLWLGDQLEPIVNKIHSQMNSQFPHLKQIGTFVATSSANRVQQSLRTYAVYKRQNFATNVSNTCDTYFEELQTIPYEQLVVFHIKDNIQKCNLYLTRLLRTFQENCTESCLVLIVDFDGSLFKEAASICTNVTRDNSNPGCRTAAILSKSVLEESGIEQGNFKHGGTFLYNIDGLYGINSMIDTYVTADYGPDFRESNYNRLVNLSVPYVEVTMSVDLERGNQRRVEICNWYRSGDCEHRLVANELYDHYSACEAIIASLQAESRNQLIKHVNNNSECFDLTESQICNPVIHKCIPQSMFDALITEFNKGFIDEAKHSLWAFSMVWVMKIILKYINNEINVPDMDAILGKTHVKLLYKYLKCKDPEFKGGKSGVNPKVFEQIAHSALTNKPVRNIVFKEFWDLIVHGDNNNNFLHFVPTLAHLNRVAEVTVILKSSNHPLVLPYALYALRILKHNLWISENNIKWRNVTNYKKHLWRNCIDELELFAKGIVHELFTRDEELSVELLLTVNKQLNCSSLHLAYTAKSNNVLSDPACIKAVNRRLWQNKSEVTHSRWLAAVLYPVYPLYYFFLYCIEKKGEIFDGRMIPAMKCMYHGIYYLGFLIAYSYSVMTTAFNSHGLNIIDYVTIGLLVSYLLDLFVRRMRGLPDVIDLPLLRQLTLEMLGFIFSLCGYIGKITMSTVEYPLEFNVSAENFNNESSSDSLDTSGEDLDFFEISFPLSITFFYIRFLLFFHIHEQIGPLITMIGTFLIDLRHFMFILLVILMSYSVSLHIILNPTNDPSFSNLFVAPFMHIFAEIGKETYDEAGPEFPARTNVAMFITVLFLLLTNVLLLNLLIAKFNSSYQTMKEDSDYHYVNNVIITLDEYEHKSIWPPPIGVIIDVVTFLIRKERCKCTSSVQPENTTDCDIFSSSHSSHRYLTSIIKNAIKKHNKEYRRDQNTRKAI